MLDLTLLRILKHKEHYDRIVPNLPEGALNEKTMIVLKDFGAYLKETGHPVVKMGAFKSYFFNFRHCVANFAEFAAAASAGNDYALLGRSVF